MVRQLPQTRNNGPQYHEEIPEMCNLRLRRDTGEQWGGDSCIYRAARMRQDNCYIDTSDISDTRGSSARWQQPGMAAGRIDSVIIVGSTAFYDHWIQNRRGAMHSSASATMHRTVGPSQP